MADTKTRFSIYLRKSMINRLKKEAADNERSANQQLVWILKKYYGKGKK